MTLRTPEFESEYQSYRKGRDKNLCPFCQKDLMRHEFKYWILMENRFYYNRIVSAQNHYLLAPKRHIGDFDKLTQEEKNEFESINYQLKQRELGDWDSMIENFPKAQSIPEHLHFHLLRKFDKV